MELKFVIAHLCGSNKQWWRRLAVVASIAGLVGCGNSPIPTPVLSPVTPGAAAATSTLPAAAATATRPPATVAPATGTTTPSGAGGRAEITVEFVKKLASSEEADELRIPLSQIPGVLDVSGDDIAMRIVYNPAVTTIDKIKERLSAMGHSVK